VNVATPAQCSRDIPSKVHLLNACPEHKCNLAICNLCNDNSSKIVKQNSACSESSSNSNNNNSNIVVNAKLIVLDIPTSAGISARVLLDCGSTTNFISKRFSMKNRLVFRDSNKVQIVKLADGSSQSACKIVTNLHLYINSKIICENLLVFPIESYDIILGMPFLKKHNPIIDWKQNSLKFPDHTIMNNINKIINDHSSSSSPPLSPPVHPSQITVSPSTPSLPQSLTSVEEPPLNPSLTTPSLASIHLAKHPSEYEMCKWQRKDIRRMMKKNYELYVIYVRPRNKQDLLQKQVETHKQHIHNTETVYQQSEMDKLRQEYIDVFPSALPKGVPPQRVIDHKITLEPNTKPPFRNYYRMSPKDLEEVKEHLTEMLDQGFIRESHSPYGAPVLLARKAGEVKRRFCVDFRDLNKVTIKDRYPIPRVEDLLDQLTGARYFTKLDLRSGYFQVRIAEEDIHKTAFVTKYGQFEFLVMPFGLTAAPSTFVSIMNNVLGKFIDKFVVVYLDDILIYSKTKDEHLSHVKLVFEALRLNKLYAKESKCEFMKSMVKFVGFIVSEHGLEVDSVKVQAVKEWPVPKSIKDCRSFLGFVSYYRKFIQNHSEIVAPISDLTKTVNGINSGCGKFIWTLEAQTAFEKMKTALCSAPVLVLPDMEKPYVINTDASGFALGACLMQDHGKGLQPVAYMSKKLLAAEKNYPVHHKELLAIITALKAWRHLVHGTKCLVRVLRVITDHKSLVHLQTQPKLSERQIRWNEFLAEFGNDLVIEYQSGKTNIVADALSRRSDHENNIDNVIHSTDDPNGEDSVYKVNNSNDPKGDENIYNIYSSNEPKGDTSIYNLSVVTSTLKQQIIDSYDHDDITKEILRIGARQLRNRTDQHISVKDGIIYYNSTRIYVPNNEQLQTLIITESHDGKVSGHLGIDKTINLIERYYYWPGLRSQVKLYVKTCLICQRIKSNTQKKAGLLQPLPIPSTKWSSVSMDFIVQLPLSKNGYDAILVVVDRLSKAAIFCAMKTTATAPDVATLFFENVCRRHGFPTSIVSDRDSKFTSLFWKSLWSLFGTKLKMSTANHPQTDGQTERTNRTLEQMIRPYVNEQQDNWDELLPYMEIAYNNAKQDSTGFSPYYINNGCDMMLPSALDNPIISENQTVEKMVSEMKIVLDKVKENLVKAQAHQKKYADTKRREEEYSVGDYILLSTSDLMYTPGQKKLLDKQIGPYKILEKIGAVAYKIELPKRLSRIHPVFHVSKLFRYHDTSAFPSRPLQENRPPPVMQIDGDDAWEVEEIVNKRINKGVCEYLVKWLNYPTWENSWLPLQNLKEAKEAIEIYESTH
jgi:reverse transcriptase-like protein/integrase-like protein/aspartyl protease/chromodomain-containing protein